MREFNCLTIESIQQLNINNLTIYLWRTLSLYNPVKLHFGRGVVENLGNAISKYGKRVLLVYGGGSIKKNGIYEQVMASVETVRG